MKQVQKGKRGKPRKKTGPLAEGIIPLKANGQRDWQSMSDDGLVAYSVKIIEEKKLTSRMDLENADSGLYDILRRRKLLDRIGLKKYGRDWSSMSDDEIVEYARGIVEKKGLGKRTELKKADNGLYEVLRKRKLLDGLFPESVRVRRMWSSMSDVEFVEYARGFIEEKGLKRREELRKADSGLYTTLRNRDLLDNVGLESSNINNRDWVSMSDDELKGYSRGVIGKKGLTKRYHLMKTDQGLYSVLYKRKLLDAVFAPIESQNKREAVQQVVDAMKEFE